MDKEKSNLEKYKIFKSEMASLKNKLGLSPNQPVRWVRYPQEFINVCNKVHDNKYSYDKSNIVSQRGFITIGCPIHGDFIQRAEDHISGHGCPKCARNVTSTKEEFIKNVRNIHGDKYDISKAEYKNDSDKFPVKCNVCGNTFMASVESLVRLKHGCPYCAHIKNSERKKGNTKDFISKARKVHGDYYDYSKVEYKDEKEKVIITCPIHGDFLQSPNNHLQGQGCPKCNFSKGEKLVSKFLDNEGISYVCQKTLPGCIYKRLLRFDFYLPEYNICIEYQGKQHYDSKSFNFRGEEPLELLKRDEVKRQYCSSHNIPLIEIPYNEPFDKYGALILETIKEFKKENS